ncbi:MAG: TRAP transporter fused permease subunit [Devosia sp.]
MVDGSPPRKGLAEAALSRLGEAACVGLAGFIAFTTVFGKLPAEAQYGTALTLGLVAVFCLRKGLPKSAGGGRSGLDLTLSVLMIVAAVATGAYYLANYHDIAAFREGIPNTYDLICYAVGTVIVIEAARRVEGMVLVLVVGAALIYLLFGHLMPGVLQHRPMPLEGVLEVAYSYQGIFGVALGAVVDVVLAFVILGAAIRVSGAGDFFNFIAARLTRGMRSGPAQGAIVASTLFGSINGSPPANVSSTGILTIPLMKRAGYRPAFAGGVEATSSCVGQIMPPIMGVGAFIMSELTGVPYATIMLIAIVPAGLFIFSLSVAAALEAGRLGISPDGAVDPGGWTGQRRAQSMVLLFAFTTLLVMLFSGYSPTYAGLSAAAVALGTAMVARSTRLGLRDIARFVVEAGRDGLPVLIACAAIGIVIGAVTSTGLGVKLNQLIVSVGSGDLFMALILAAICSIVLGMGLPTAASYLMVVFVAGPSLVALGVSLLQSHFFVFYYAVLSAITPPVALAVFAAAAIAKAPPLVIAKEALRLCAVGFALPIVWIYHPEIFLDSVSWQGLPLTIATLVALLIAIVAFNAAHIGYVFVSLDPLRRLALAVCAVGAVTVDWRVQAAAIGVIVVILAERRMAALRARPAVAE